MVCRECGTTNPDNATYCSECGGKLTALEIVSENTKIQLSDPKNRIILGMGIVIIVLLILLIIK